MTKFRSLLAVFFLFVPGFAFAQSADQTVVSVVDSPDPAVPGNNITYTVTVTNNGPDPAVNGGLNGNLSGTLTFVSASGPAGFTCGNLGNNLSCTHPAFPVGVPAVFTVVGNLPVSLQAFPDGSVTSNFSTSGVTPDPNNGNNTGSATTSYDSPQAELSIGVLDSPDPVFPDGDITYAVTVTNGGPQAALNTNLNVPLNNTLRVTSVTAPAGWNCGTITPGQGSSFTCSNPSAAVGTHVFSIVLRANDEQFGINDGTIMQFFGVNSAVYDSNNANNGVTISTAYVTPDANLGVTASDSPDPVAPDGDITYTVTVTNAGPDAAVNARLNVALNNTLRVTSVTAPAGWNCGTITPGQGTSFTCTNGSFPNGGNAGFTIVLRANDEQFGINDQTIVQNFSINSDVADPVNANNSVNVSTLYSTPDANLSVTATDSPDPVTPGNNITYSGTISNAGTDAAPNTQVNMPLTGSTLFQSLSAPAGFSCTTPAVGGTGAITCTSASFAIGSGNFTLVVQVSPSLLNGPDGIIQQQFSIGSSIADPVHANDSITVYTAYATPKADISVTNVDAPDPTTTGGTITYTQTITNNGPDTANSVVFSQSVPAGTTFQSLAAGVGFSCTTPAVGGTGNINCTLASLASAQTRTFTLVVNVTATSGPIGSTVNGSSSTYDPDPLDNSATASTALPAASADLSITKTTNATNAVRNANIVYTITLTNAGPNTAASVVMTDALPASLLFQSLSAPAGFTCTTPAVGVTGTITCNAATLANGATATFTLTARVASNATGNVSNTASISSATSDPNGGNSSGGTPLIPAVSGTGEDIPTMSQWMLIAMAAVLAATALAKLRL